VLFHGGLRLGRGWRRYGRRSGRWWQR
jgi:hypothetical protein